MKNQILSTLGLLLFITLLSTSGVAQSTQKVLFLGNSYTGYNNLPKMVKDLALSAGDTLILDSYTPGGFRLKDHADNPASIQKLVTNNWDKVVIQGQSQEPIIQFYNFMEGGYQLNDSIKKYHPCSETVLYMTWGRENGDATNCQQFPAMCTYQSMDSAIQTNYKKLANSISSTISPVGAVWRALRENHPSIDLYNPDESHPSLRGSYAAACAFYATLFHKNPTLITDTYGIPSAEAIIIQNVAKNVVYDQLSQWDYFKKPSSSFYYSVSSGVNNVDFVSVGFGIDQNYLWLFGDGNSSTQITPNHHYTNDGTYLVQLITSTCNTQGIFTDTTDTVIQFCPHTPTISPAGMYLCKRDSLKTQTADSYQWFAAYQPIPVKDSIVTNYEQYNTSVFSVQTEVNGCKEMSKTFKAIPEWSGFYFDGAFSGDPCEGDTGLFIVNNTNGLTGSEVLLWFRNNTLLPDFTNNDSLRFTQGGSYVGAAIAPDGNCPSDTIFSTPLVFNCDNDTSEGNATIGEDFGVSSKTLSVYPNPSAHQVTISLSNENSYEKLLVYNSIGALWKAISLQNKPTSIVEVSDWPKGIYFLKVNQGPTAILYVN